MEKTFIIEGMKCQGCIDIVTENFKTIGGVNDVSINLDTKEVNVKLDKDISLDDFQNTLNDTNFKIIEEK